MIIRHSMFKVFVENISFMNMMNSSVGKKLKLIVKRNSRNKKNIIIDEKSGSRKSQIV